MGLRLEYRESDQKYRFWSTVVDAWLTDWLDRDGCLHYLYERWLREFQKSFIKEYFCFPHNWCDKDRTLHKNDVGWDLHRKWIEQLFEKAEDEYDEFIEARFKDALRLIHLDG